MEYSYYDSNNNVRKIKVAINMNWASLKTGISEIDSLFDLADKKGYTSGIVEPDEISFLNSTIKSMENSPLKIAERQDTTPTVSSGNTVRSQSSNDILTKFQDPNWVKTEGVKYLSEISDRDLYFAINEYSKNRKYILDEISKNQDIPKEVRDEFVNTAIAKIEKHLGYETSEWNRKDDHVKTDFYTSEDSFDVKFDNNVLTITQKKKPTDTQDPKVYRINLNTLLQKVAVDARPKILKELQSVPAEVLVDMAIELDYFVNPSRNSGAAYYTDIDDNIALGVGSIDSIKSYHIVHEIGHAIDHRRQGVLPETSLNANQNNDGRRVFFNQSSISQNEDLKEAYYKAKENGSRRDYMFSDIVEGPSELYAMAMTGEYYTTSKSAVNSDLMNKFIDSLKFTRSLSPLDRHERQGVNYFYHDDKGNIQYLDIEVGKKWSDVKTGSAKLDAVIQRLNTGDGIIQYSELLQLGNYLQAIDNQDLATSNNLTLEKSELDKVNPETLTKSPKYSRGSLSAENFKIMYPPDKYDYSNDNQYSLIITDKQTKEIKVTIDRGASTITEYTADNQAIVSTISGTSMGMKYVKLEDK